MTATKVERRRHQPTVSRVIGFPERVALFVAAVHKARAEELLSGLSEAEHQRASDFAAAMKGWDSAGRQARLAHEFGVRHDASERLNQLVVQASGELRGAIVASLPPAIRSQFPQFAGSADAFPVAIRAIAARLVKEASR